MARGQQREYFPLAVAIAIDHKNCQNVIEGQGRGEGGKGVQIFNNSCHKLEQMLLLMRGLRGKVLPLPGEYKVIQLLLLLLLILLLLLLLLLGLLLSLMFWLTARGHLAVCAVLRCCGMSQCISLLNNCQICITLAYGVACVYVCACACVLHVKCNANFHFN